MAATRFHRLGRIGVALLASAALTALSGAAVAHADTAVKANATITVGGAGWGHGKGLSQYGAYGRAKAGLSYSAITSFYYPGTKLTSLTGTKRMRVWITADTDNSIDVLPAAGLRVYDSKGHKVNLPTGSSYTRWKIYRSGGKQMLAARNQAGKYVTYASKLDPKRSWWLENTKTRLTTLILPSGATKVYPDRLSLKTVGSSQRVVNYLSIETYLRAVVPAEMPAEWGSSTNKGMAALKAQAVAARTYAIHERASKPSGSAYDICDSSACQVYKDVSWRYSYTDTAVSATAGKILTYKGKAALTQFTNSNGGWTAAATGYPYLSAKRDTYDDDVRSQTWTKSLSTTKIAKAYPSIGTFTSIQVTKRTGVGPYSGQGRVSKVKLTGTKGSVTVSGGSFKAKFGLKETLFRLSGTSVDTTAVTAKK